VPTIRRADDTSVTRPDAARPTQPTRQARTADPAPPTRTAIPRRTTDAAPTRTATPIRDRGDIQPRTTAPTRGDRADSLDRTTRRVDDRSATMDRGRVIDTRNRSLTRDDSRTTRTRGDGLFSERSTMSHQTSSIRAGSSTPHAPLPRTTTRTHSTYRPSSYGTWNYGHYGYWGVGTWGWHHGYYSPWWSSGVSFSIGWGWRSGWGIGWGWGWHGGHWSVWHSPFISYTRWGIARISVRGWYGYHFGHRCYYWSARSWNRPHWHYYRGVYCRVSRPYWYGYSRWYDWRPYRYGYAALSYDRIYDEGYTAGYDRGYIEGAEDTSAYRDDRRRDRIAEAPRPRTPVPSVDRQRGDAATEYRHEMNRGNDAFGKGDFRNATRAFREAVIMNPHSADARYSLAISAFAEGKYAFSAFALRRGITLDEDGSNIDVEAALGGPSVMENHIEMLERDLQQAPTDPDLLLLRGFVALRTGDARTAADTLDRALAALPGDEATQKLHAEAMHALENQ
jgi:hypothetical protein